MKVEVKENVYWVGAIDWNLRNFHGYQTEAGSTYNAFLIVDEKITLIDTVKSYLFDQMLRRISEIIDPSKIDYIICNHAEMDHSGSLMKMKEVAPNAEIIVNEKNGEKIFRGHFHDLGDVTTVSETSLIKTGKYSFAFLPTPMVHWPESMVTYSAELKILFSSDAFGQHYATPQRFDDEVSKDILFEQAKKYYGNIVFLYGRQTLAVLEKAKDLDIEIIAPDHGVIWRTYVSEIVDKYFSWAKHENKRQALIVYDTMWDSTKKIALALARGIEDEGVAVVIRDLKVTHISDAMSDLVEASLVLVGSPTLNNGILPTVGAFLTYIKGLRPSGKTGFAFGSYGWGGQSPKEIAEVLKSMGWELPIEPMRVNWLPKEEDLEKAEETGRNLAKIIKESEA